MIWEPKTAGRIHVAINPAFIRIIRMSSHTTCTVYLDNDMGIEIAMSYEEAVKAWQTFIESPRDKALARDIRLDLKRLKNNQKTS